MPKKEIIVYVKRPGEPARQRVIPNTLEALQQIVGGYIETVTFTSDLVVICNEEGRLINLPFNCEFLGVDFVGTIIFAGRDEDEFADCPEISPDVMPSGMDWEE